MAAVATISSAILCDFAQVREGLLFVMSGGITRVLRPELPGKLGVKAAVVVEIGPEEIDQQHHVVVAVKHPASAQELARVGTTFQAGGALEPGESLYVPLVVDLCDLIREARALGC